MQLYTKEQAIRQMNYLGQSCRPFIFIQGNQEPHFRYLRKCRRYL